MYIPVSVVIEIVVEVVWAARRWRNRRRSPRLVHGHGVLVSGPAVIQGQALVTRFSS
jgi:hypothetical protein